MIQNHFTISWRFWLFWALAFLGFPIGGFIANLIVGPVATALRAGIAGAIVGVVLGLIQWFVLRAQIPMPFWWIIATSAGMALGLAISVALLGSEVSGNSLLGRAVITGVIVGAAQWLVLRQILPQSWIWIVVVALGWGIGWFITRSAGIDLDFKWPVFGASGALVFQLLTGLALYFLLRSSQGITTK
jgi:serine/threonine-protein kinase